MINVFFFIIYFFFNFFIKSRNLTANISSYFLKDFSKLISKKSEPNKSYIKKIKLNKIKKDNYIKLNKDNLINYYNEIEEFILDNNKIPDRLKSSLNKNKKNLSKKRGRFRKMVKNNYRINNGRLQYNYNCGKNAKWLYIPYESEVDALLNYTHYNNNHLKKIEWQYI